MHSTAIGLLLSNKYSEERFAGRKAGINAGSRVALYGKWSGMLG